MNQSQHDFITLIFRRHNVFASLHGTPVSGVYSKVLNFESFIQKKVSNN